MPPQPRGQQRMASVVHPEFPAVLQTRARLLVISFPDGAAGPQRNMQSLLAHAEFLARVEFALWCPGDHYRGLLGKWRLWRQMRQFVHGRRDWTLYINQDLSFAFWLALCARLAGCRDIAVHARSALPAWASRVCFRGLAQRWMRWAVRRKLAISDSAARAMFGSAREVMMLPCLIDFEALWAELAQHAPRPRLYPGFVFACVARLAPEKNQDLLIKALARVRADGLDAQLLLIGEGGDGAALDALARALDVAHAVHRLGPQAHIGPWYHEQSDAVLIPSALEAQSRVAAEAQYFGVPVAASSAVPQWAFLEPSKAMLGLGLDVETWSKAMQDLALGRVQQVPERSSLAEGSPLAMRNGVRPLLDAVFGAGERP